MRKALIDLIDKSGMVENRKRCEIIADELLAAGVCFAPVEIVIRKDITDDMLRRMQNALAMPAMIMPYDPGQETVEIVPQWIPVTERLPVAMESVLFLGANRNMFVGWLVPSKEEIRCARKGEATEIIGVTHWMPLPQPPEEVQE